MMEVTKTLVNGESPILSLVFAITADLTHQVEWLARYLVEIDSPCVEIVAVLSEAGQPCPEPGAKNLGARQASCDYLAFTSAGIYPPASLIVKTRRELGLEPDRLLMAWRLDGTRDCGVFPNPFALGDWQCCTKATFEKLGGYDDGMAQPCGIENKLIGAAVHHDCSLVMMDERLFHAWHASHWGLDVSENAERNMRRVLDAGLPWVTIHYPDKAIAEYADGSTKQVKLMSQQDSVVDMTLHAPKHPQYWDMIFFDKERRVYVEGSESRSVEEEKMDSDELQIDDDTLEAAWQHIDKRIMGIEMLLHWKEAAMLYLLASKPTASGHVVEIGGWFGGSTSVLGIGCQERGVPVITVDHWKSRVVTSEYGWDDSVYVCWYRNVEKAKLHGTAVPMMGDSREVVKYWWHPISLLFIDGGHFFGIPKADFEAWSPFVSLGGIMAVHDAEDKKPEVVQLCKEISSMTDVWSDCGKIESMHLYQRIGLDEKAIIIT